MATRQYIGARYVPKFYVNSVDGSATWESNVVYEPLTYVTLQNGHMYLSKKEVPATVGTPASNADYWLDVGSYNGFIDDLQNQINTLDDEIDDVNTRIDHLGDRHFLCVTDSYGEFPNASSSWVEKFAAIVGSANVTKAYKGGYGFSPVGYTAPFINLITPGSVDTGVPSGFDTSKVTDIVVLGGFNDRSTPVNTILGAIGSFCTYARATYQNLKNIYIGAVGWSMNSEHIQTLNHGLYISAYKLCGQHGAIYLDGMENIMHDFALFNEENPSANVQVLSHNYVHPNAAGAQYIANYLVSALFGGAVSVQYAQATFAFNTVSNLRVGTGNSFGTVQQLVGDKCRVEVGTMNLNHADNSAFSIGGAQTKIELGIIDKGYVNADVNNIRIPVHVFIAGGNVTGNMAMAGSIMIEYGKFILEIDNLVGGSYAPTNIYCFGCSGLIMNI